ncbi:hypothetical protein TNIN_370491 [Trichonephila inaurata madagascariensis]|uniref:DDE-1 domain-containing protein n=1 Tax=Trichonephila inaurata madagascariensis TaxID=2747483 RepID=A0A8X6YPK1_9ARAC|nr:hypothetical protein TNIN_370491 [Trichonephila inaurata madagascariensis]
MLMKQACFGKECQSEHFCSVKRNKHQDLKLQTLLLGGKASGDFKLKPLLVYHSKNPRAMKGISKSTLLVIWKSNKESRMSMKFLSRIGSLNISARLLNVIAKLKT